MDMIECYSVLKRFKYIFFKKERKLMQNKFISFYDATKHFVTLPSHDFHRGHGWNKHFPKCVCVWICMFLCMHPYFCMQK